MTLLEAMSLGKPCVVTDVGGNPEIVKEGATGRVTPNADAHAFANATLTLLDSQNAMSASSDNARTRFEDHFTSQKTIGHYKRLYTAL
jgi:glycosyltransferase involved in cell wall biosynthesis